MHQTLFTKEKKSGRITQSRLVTAHSWHQNAVSVEHGGTVGTAQITRYFIGTSVQHTCANKRR